LFVQHSDALWVVSQSDGSLRCALVLVAAAAAVATHTAVADEAADV